MSWFSRTGLGMFTGVRAWWSAVLIVLLAFLAVSGGLALNRLHMTVSQIESIYAHEVVPLQLLRSLSHEYAATVVDTVHKVRDGSIGFDEAVVVLRQSRQRIDQDWRVFTELQEVTRAPSAGPLVNDAQSRQLVAHRLIDRLMDLARAYDMAGWEKAAALDLYPAIDPVSEVLGRLVASHQDVARLQAEQTLDRYRDLLWTIAIMAVVLVSAAVLGLGSAAARYLHDVREGRQRALRLAELCAAAGRVTQGLSREQGERQLLVSLAQVCVDSHWVPAVAALLLVEDDEVECLLANGVAVKCVGEAGSPATLSASSPERRLLVSRTASSAAAGTRSLSGADGLRYLCRDYQAAGGPAVEGIGAMLALSVRRAGRVVGTLNLYAADAEGFDDVTMKVLTSVTVDASLALDALDQAARHQAAVQHAESGYLRFSELFHASPIAMSVLAVDDSRVLDINEAGCQLHGYSRDDMLGRTTVELGIAMPEPDRSRVADVFRTQGRVRAMDARQRTRRASLVDVLISVDPLSYDERPALLVSSVDLSERKRVERALQDHQEMLAGILATATDAVVAINGRSEVVVFNEAAQLMFGVTADDVRGRSAERFVPLRARRRYREMLAAFVAGGQVSQMINNALGLTALRADGTEFPIEASISRLGQGEEMLMTLFVRDVTQWRSAERARAAQVAAEAANHAKTKFLSMMSHELRTPLNAVLGFSQLLQTDEEHPLTPVQRDQVAHIRRAGEHLMALINNTLDMTSIESGQFHVTHEPVDVHELALEAMRMVEPQAREARVQLLAVKSATTAGVRAMADPVRLRQVLLNLLSNAVKYNRPGGSVKTTLHASAHEVRIEVADTGRGMNPSQVRQLFEPFNRLGRERDGIEGTGLGLALTRQLVMLMNGEIAIESEVGRGTQVSVTLEAADASREMPQQLPLLDDDPALLQESTMEPEGVVLYIEDEPVNRMIVDQLLSRWPRVRLVQAETGRDGLDLARSIHPDLVLLDMGLPDLRGEQVLQALRRDPATVNLPVVVLSGSTLAADMVAVERFGVLDYWAKPLDFDRFVTDMMRRLPMSTVRASTWGQL